MGIPTYTKVPRAILWLLRGDEFEAGPAGEGFWVEVGAFYISKHPVTNVQFEAFRPDHRRGETSPEDDGPVVNVGFADAVAYCAWYSEVSQKMFRLPTEMEWEYAAGSGERTRYPWGEDPERSNLFAWTLENAEGACSVVGLLEANEAGLHDMLGNMWEWTASLDLPFPVQEGDGRDAPELPGMRIQRGGGFRDAATSLSTGSRRAVEPECATDEAGFRIVRSL
jgi:formylglycine-generating enzyme required for sulfatase activity